MNMQLQYSDEQNQLAEAIRDLLASTPDKGTMGALASLGTLGLSVIEAAGGEGAGLVEVGVVAREVGARLPEAPFASSAVVATLVLAEFAADRNCAALLSAIVAGDVTTTAPWDLVGAVVSRTPTPHLDPATSTVTGIAVHVPFASEAQRVLLEVADAVGGRHLVVIDPTADAVKIEETQPFDLSEPLATVTFDRAPAQVLVGPDEINAGLERARGRIAAVFAMELVGTGTRVLQTAVDYAKVRTQFRRAIGSFQAVKHMLAEAHMALDAASALAHYACSAFDAEEPDALVTARLALASSLNAATISVLNAMQTFGGVGYTWEQGSHHYLRRIRSRTAQFGSFDRQLDAIADARFNEAGAVLATV